MPWSNLPSLQYYREPSVCKGLNEIPQHQPPGTSILTMVGQYKKNTTLSVIGMSGDLFIC